MKKLCSQILNHKLFSFSAILLSLFAATPLYGKENQVEQYKLDNGIPFYYLQNTDNSIDAIIISVEGNSYQLTGDKSGIESVLFDVMASGSTQYNSDFIKKYEYETGTRIRSKSEADYSMLTMECPADTFEEALPIFLSCFVSPAFDYSDFQKVRNEKLKAMSNTMNNPDTSLGFYATNYLANRQYYCGTPYITPESSQNINPRTIYSHYNSIMDSGRIKVLVVSHKSANLIYKELNKQLGSISSSEKALKQKPASSQTPELKGTMVFTHQKANKSGFTSRIIKYPEANSTEAFALSVAELIYTDLLKSVLCEKYEICSSAYATHSPFIRDFGYETYLNCTDFENLEKYQIEARSILIEGKYISSTTDSGDFIFDSIENVLEGYKNSFITSLYSKNVTSLGTLYQLLDSILYQNSQDFQGLAISKIRNLTAEDIIKTFTRYYATQNEFWICVVSPEFEEQVEKAFDF